MVADPLDRTGKAEERRALKRVRLQPPGALAPACSREPFHELERSLDSPARGGQCPAEAGHMSSRNSDHVIVAMNRVMTGERRAWRREEATSEEIGTAHRGGQPY